MSDSDAPRRVVLVAAVARNGVIGDGPDIPWHVPGEQRAFKQLTLGHTLVMGRTTYESIGRPLPGRRTVVLTRERGWSPSPAPGAEEVLVAHGAGEALRLAAALPGDAMIAGGARVYEAVLPRATHQVISEIPLEPRGDCFYPAVDKAAWLEERREVFEGYERVWWRRVAGAAAEVAPHVCRGRGLA